MSDAETARVLEYCRAAFVGLLYVIGCLIFDVSWPKAAGLFVALFFLQVAYLGTRRIEQLAVLFFLLALFSWVGLLPLQRWSQMVSLHMTQCSLTLSANAPSTGTPE